MLFYCSQVELPVGSNDAMIQSIRDRRYFVSVANSVTPGRVFVIANWAVTTCDFICCQIYADYRAEILSERWGVQINGVNDQAKVESICCC